MTGYIINFSIYTTAMIGVIFVALFTFKKFSTMNFSKKVSMLNIEDSMKLSARKTLYVIKAKDERFLIASDVDNTSLIAKLDDGAVSLPLTLDKTELNKGLDTELSREDKSTRLKSFDGVEGIKEFASVIDFNKQREKKGPMMKELARKLSDL